MPFYAIHAATVHANEHGSLSVFVVATGIAVIVGGPVFVQVPDLWKKLGADGYAAGVEDAEPLGSELTS